MTEIVFAQEVTSVLFETGWRLNLDYLPLGDYYWRVKTRIPNAGDVWSDVQKLTLAIEDAVEDTELEKEMVIVEKRVEDGQVYIYREGIIYNLLGSVVNK